MIRTSWVGAPPSKPPFNCCAYAVVLPANKAFAGIADPRGRARRGVVPDRPQNIVATRDEMTAVTLVRQKKACRPWSRGGPTPPLSGSTSCGISQPNGVERRGTDRPRRRRRAVVVGRDRVSQSRGGAARHDRRGAAGSFRFDFRPRREIRISVGRADAIESVGRNETTTKVATDSEAKPVTPTEPSVDVLPSRRRRRR